MKPTPTTPPSSAPCFPSMPSWSNNHDDPMRTANTATGPLDLTAVLGLLEEVQQVIDWHPGREVTEQDDDDDLSMLTPSSPSSSTLSVSSSASVFSGDCEPTPIMAPSSSSSSNHRIRLVPEVSLFIPSNNDEQVVEDIRQILQPLLRASSHSSSFTHHNDNEDFIPNLNHNKRPSLEAEEDVDGLFMLTTHSSSRKKQRILNEQEKEHEDFATRQEEPETTISSFFCNTQDSHNTNTNNERFRMYQAEQWNERYEDLVTFCNTMGHCHVPHKLPSNPSLAQWTKRQRYQYKLLMSGKHSTLTKERVIALEQLGFVWDSHTAAWEERYQELVTFQTNYGHCNVPSTYLNNPSLAVWVKCQRRNYKLFSKGQKSHITIERIRQLSSLGFCWNPRRGPGRGSGSSSSSIGSL